MGKKKKESYFWTSYSDLMTSLFFIMLVLFVLAICLLSHRIAVTHAKADSTKELLNNKDFDYNKKFEKFVLKVPVYFPETESDFKWLDEGTKRSLDRVGDEIIAFLNRHKDTKYLLIVEGQASRNSEKQMDDNYSYSFLRAKNLMKFWLQEKKKNFGDNCEVQIAGSGDGRLNVKILSAYDNPYNKKNQRFLIYIIPKNIFE